MISTIENTHALLVAAGLPRIPIIADYEKQKFTTLQDTLLPPEHIDTLSERMVVLEIIAKTEVSDEVRQECMQEMEQARLTGWKVIQ